MVSKKFILTLTIAFSCLRFYVERIFRLQIYTDSRVKERFFFFTLGALDGT